MPALFRALEFFASRFRRGETPGGRLDPADNPRETLLSRSGVQTLTGVLLLSAAAVWVADAAVGAWLRAPASLPEQLFSPEPAQFWTRVASVAVLFFFGGLSLFLLRQSSVAAEQARITLEKRERKLREEIEEARREARHLEKTNHALAQRAALCELTVKLAEHLGGAAELDEMLQRCGETLSTHCDASCCLIWTLEGAERHLNLRAGAGMDLNTDSVRRLPFGEGEIGKIAEHRRPNIVSDPAELPEILDREWMRAHQIAAFAGYPLLVDSELVGVLAIFSQRPLGDYCAVALEVAARTIALGIARKRAADRLRTVEEQLRQAQKLEAIGRLAGGVAHDFNNLLTVIMGYGEILLAQPLAESQRALVQMICESGRRAADLTKKLLIFSRKQPTQPIRVDVNQAITELASMLRRLIGEHIELELDLAKENLAVLADPSQIETVLLNLLVNARDAMPEGGTVQVGTRKETRLQPWPGTEESFRPGEYVVICVSDEGVGMSQEVKERIFEPFFTTKEIGKGTGLGLSTVYGIVTQAGGHITCYSEVGVGTTFRIYLPLRDPMAESAAGDEEPEPLPGGTETILLAEDEDAVRKFAQRILEECGYRVLAAATGDEALELARSHPEPIDLVLTDVVMPKIGGRELARRIAEVHPKARVVFMSGYPSEFIESRGILDEGAILLDKPFSPLALAQTVRETLDQGGE